MIRDVIKRHLIQDLQSSRSLFANKTWGKYQLSNISNNIESVLSGRVLLDQVN